MIPSVEFVMKSREVLMQRKTAIISWKINEYKENGPIRDKDSRKLECPIVFYIYSIWQMSLFRVTYKFEQDSVKGSTLAIWWWWGLNLGPSS